MIERCLSCHFGTFLARASLISAITVTPFTCVSAEFQLVVPAYADPSQTISSNHLSNTHGDLSSQRAHSQSDSGALFFISNLTAQIKQDKHHLIDNGLDTLISANTRPDYWAISVLRLPELAVQAHSFDVFHTTVDTPPDSPNDIASVFGRDTSQLWVMRSAINLPNTELNFPLIWEVSGRVWCQCPELTVMAHDIEGVALFAEPHSVFTLRLAGLDDQFRPVSLIVDTTRPVDLSGSAFIDVEVTLTQLGSPLFTQSGHSFLMISGLDAEQISGQFFSAQHEGKLPVLLAGQFWSSDAAQISN